MQFQNNAYSIFYSHYENYHKIMDSYVGVWVSVISCFIAVIASQLWNILASTCRNLFDGEHQIVKTYTSGNIM
jgi:leucyl-tRNA synthetase